MANLKLNTAMLMGAIAETNCLKAEVQAADLDGIKAKFRERLMACVKAREEVRETIQEQLPFILENAKVNTSRWGGGVTEYFVGDDTNIYDEAADGYEKDRYDLKIRCDASGAVTNVLAENISKLNAARLGIQAGYIGCAYGFLHATTAEDAEKAVNCITREMVDKMDKEITRAEEYIEKVYLPMVGILFGHIRDRIARLAYQLKAAEDKVSPKVTHRVVIEITKVG